VEQQHQQQQEEEVGKILEGQALEPQQHIQTITLQESAPVDPMVIVPFYPHDTEDAEVSSTSSLNDLLEQWEESDEEG
jgi:hypothetical protein